jgi:long-subunit fatty acid transport protein
MKKIILSAVAVLAFGFTNAQDVKFGAKAGLNISNITGDTDELGYSSKTGLFFGGFAEVKISDKFSFQPELLFSNLGVKSEEVDILDDYKYESKIVLNYLNVPLMAKFYVADKFSLEAGPQLGFLLSSKAKYTETFDGDTESGSEDIKDTFNGFDFGFNFGTSYDFTNNISAGVRYSVGLSNILKDSGSFKSHNSNLAFALAYKF